MRNNEAVWGPQLFLFSLGGCTFGAFKVRLRQQLARSTSSASLASSFGTMAGDGNDSVKAANSELTFLLTREKVDPKIISSITDAGIDTVKQFAALAPNAEEFRKLALASFSLGEGKTLIECGKLAKVMCSWESARARSTRAAEIEGKRGLGRAEAVALQRFRLHESGLRDELLGAWRSQDASSRVPGA